MAWQLNNKGGLFKKGAESSFQKRHQILQTFLTTGNKTLTAELNLCSYNLVSKIADKFAATGLCEPGDRGRPPKKMDVWKRAYLEVLVYVNPFMYLNEVQTCMQTDLNLANHEVSLASCNLQYSQRVGPEET